MSDNLPAMLKDIEKDLTPDKLDNFKSIARGLTPIAALLSLFHDGGVTSSLTVSGSLEMLEKFRPGIQARMCKWLIQLYRDIEELKVQVGKQKVEAQVMSEQFDTAFARCLDIVKNDHSQEKQDAARNILLNIATGVNTADEIQVAFLTILEGLSGAHLRILAFAYNPKAYLSARGLWQEQYDSLNNYPDLKPFPELTSDSGDVMLYETFVADLIARKLIDQGPLFILGNIPSGRPGKYTSHYLTAYGLRFYQFVTALTVAG